MLCLSPKKYLLTLIAVLHTFFSFVWLCDTWYSLLHFVCPFPLPSHPLTILSFEPLKPQSSLNPLIFSKSFSPPLTHYCDTEHTLWSVCQMLLARFAVSDVMAVFTLLWMALASPELCNLFSGDVWTFGSFTDVNQTEFKFCSKRGASHIFPVLVRKLK